MPLIDLHKVSSAVDRISSNQPKKFSQMPTTPLINIKKSNPSGSLNVDLARHQPANYALLISREVSIYITPGPVRRSSATPTTYVWIIPGPLLYHPILCPAHLWRYDRPMGLFNEVFADGSPVLSRAQILSVFHLANITSHAFKEKVVLSSLQTRHVTLDPAARAT
ncbi:hypothetical protein VTG60DRAFT_6397 [Thermothelomyces hinnuleus]